MPLFGGVGLDYIVEVVGLGFVADEMRVALAAVVVDGADFVVIVDEQGKWRNAHQTSLRALLNVRQTLQVYTGAAWLGMRAGVRRIIVQVELEHPNDGALRTIGLLALLRIHACKWGFF